MELGRAVDAFLDDERAELTLEIYSELVARLRDCAVDDRGIVPTCSAYVDLQKVENHPTPLSKMRDFKREVGWAYLDDEHPAVRLQAAKLLQSVIGSSPEVESVLVAAARSEGSAPVLGAMLRTIGPRHRDNAEIRALLLQMAEHDSPFVRREAMSWFLTSFGAGVAGTFEKVLEKVDRDPDLKVRAYLCSRRYGSSDARAVPVFKRYLSASDTLDELYVACFQGAVNAWTGFPKPRAPNRDAYELTLTLLEQRPRTAKRPPWQAISTLRSAKTNPAPHDRLSQAWLEQVKPWFDEKRLLRALEALATDGQAKWMARTAALRVMHELGVPSATFSALKTRYAAATGDDAHVARQLESILEKLAPGGTP